MDAPLRNGIDAHDTPSEALNERGARSMAGFAPSNRSGSDSGIAEGTFRSFSCSNSLSIFFNIVNLF